MNIILKEKKNNNSDRPLEKEELEASSKANHHIKPIYKYWTATKLVNRKR